MSFIHDDFILHNEISKKLYHEISSKQRIIDYHCHLDPKMIAEDIPFNDITEIWLLGDHYKWRAMRANGIPEKYITGDSTNKEKFAAWAKTLESCVGNPLYHWSALELKRYFDIDEVLNEDNWEEIWEKANEVIKERAYSPKKIIEMSNVDYVCTTDAPNDDLHWHELIKEDKNFKTVVAPGFRPDEMFALNTAKFYNFFEKLEKNVNRKISSYDEFIKAVYERIDYFNQRGCTVSDHGLGALYFVKYTKEEIDEIFNKVLRKEHVNDLELKKYLSSVFVDLGKKYVELNWVMQIHYGAIRNNDELIFNTIGPDAGTDSMMDQGDVAANLNLMLSTLKLNNGLPKFIIYNLEPSQNHMLACTLANFTSNLPHKAQLQYGSGWWFNDTKEGMLRQLKALADQGLLMNFVGMLTDSRSFISYIRHEYFRRILCEYIGDLVIKGEIPNDEKLLTRLIKNISYDNAKEYFALEGEIVMKMTFRWYGKDDPVTLEYIRQIPGITDVVTAVYTVPVGEVWPMEDILELKSLINANGLTMEVIESIPVHEDIKLGRGDYKRYIENYKENIRRCAKAGVKVVCYNFMPVFDWTRTELDHVREDGSTCLVFYKDQLKTMDPTKASLPGWDSSFTPDEMAQLIEDYKELGEEGLWKNLEYFIKEIIPVAIECDVKMAIHPDDPPYSIFGIPRIITNVKNYRRFLSIYDDIHHGLTMCAGSLGCDPNNDYVAMVKEFGPQGRIHFAHLRNIKILEDGSFEESGHITSEGSLDFAEIVKTYHSFGYTGYARPDHGRMIWGETGKPGYGLYDRALGVTYVNGLWEMCEKLNKGDK